MTAIGNRPVRHGGVGIVVALLVVTLGTVWPGAAMPQGFLAGDTATAADPSYPLIRKKKKKKKRLTPVRRRPEVQRPVPGRGAGVSPPLAPAVAPAPMVEQSGQEWLSEQEEEEEDASLQPMINGFFESRSMARQDDKQAGLDRIAPLPSTPLFTVLANLQVHARTDDERLGVAGDFSLYGASFAPEGLALINEAYVDGQVLGSLRLLVGRRRLVWGSGLAWNPTDIINPPKDALDPEWQRTGAFLLPMVDLSLGPVILSGFISPRAQANSWGFPDRFRFDRAIYAARVYALVKGVDASLIYYRDQLRGRNLFGVTASGFVSEVFELHGEALGRPGPADLPPVPLLPMCGGPTPPEGKGFPVSALIGARAHFTDQSIGVLEYAYDPNGLDGDNYQRFLNSLPCVAAAMSSAGAAASAGQENPLGLPVNTALLIRRHHVFLSYIRPHLDSAGLADVSVTGRAAVSVEDLSAVLHLEVGYRLSGSALVSGQISYWAGSKTSEMGLWPGRALGTLQLRISY